MLRSTVIALVLAAHIAVTHSACPNACSGRFLGSETASKGCNEPWFETLLELCPLQATATAAQKSPIKISVSATQHGWEVIALSVSPFSFVSVFFQNKSSTNCD